MSLPEVTLDEIRDEYLRHRVAQRLSWEAVQKNGGLMTCLRNLAAIRKRNAANPAPELELTPG